MTYTKQTWNNGPLGGTPISADRLNHIEDGVASSVQVFNPYHYGAVGDGVADDTIFLQDAIDAAISAGATSTTRHGLGKFYLPRGTFRITASLRVESCLSFCWDGEGDASIILVDADMAAAVDLNGVAISNFSNFTIQGTTGNQVTRGLWLRWGTGIGRSTVNNHFENIIVRNLEYVRGFQIGEDAAVNQVDTDVWINCHATGAWTEGETTLYQHGFYVGSGTVSNNLLHTFLGCGAISNRRNLFNNATEVAWFGGILQHAEADLLVGASGFTRVSGLRSEGSERFLDTVGPAGYPAHVNITDIDFSPDNLNADNNIYKWNLGGHLSISNFYIVPVAGKAPKITATNAGGAYTVHLDSISCTTAVSAFASVYTGNKLTITNYVQLDATGAAITATPFVTNGPINLSDDTGATTYGVKSVAGLGVGTIGHLIADAQGAGGGIRFYDDGVGHIVRNGGSSREIQFDSWKFVIMPRAVFYDFVDAAYISSNDLQLNDTAGNNLVHVNASKLGFFGVTPVTRPTAIVDADGTLADLTTKFNSLLGKLRALGLLT